VAQQIANFFDNIVLKEHSWKIKLFKNWENIIGNFKDQVIIAKIDRRVLTLGVTHPIYAQELFLLSDILKQKINSYLATNYIKEIRFKTIAHRKKHPDLSEILRNNNPVISNNNIDNIPLTGPEHKSLSKVTNEELRVWLKRFYSRCKRGKDENKE